MSLKAGVIVGCVCVCVVSGVSQRVRHAEERVCERFWLGCVPPGGPGLALWRRWRSGVAQRGLVGSWWPYAGWD